MAYPLSNNGLTIGRDTHAELFHTCKALHGISQLNDGLELCNANVRQLIIRPGQGQVALQTQRFLRVLRRQLESLVAAGCQSQGAAEMLHRLR